MTFNQPSTSGAGEASGSIVIGTLIADAAAAGVMVDRGGEGEVGGPDLATAFAPTGGRECEGGGVFCIALAPAGGMGEGAVPVRSSALDPTGGSGCKGSGVFSIALAPTGGMGYEVGAIFAIGLAPAGGFAPTGGSGCEGGGVFSIALAPTGGMGREGGAVFSIGFTPITDGRAGKAGPAFSGAMGPGARAERPRGLLPPSVVASPKVSCSKSRPRSWRSFPFLVVVSVKTRRPGSVGVS